MLTQKRKGAEIDNLHFFAPLRLGVRIQSERDPR